MSAELQRLVVGDVALDDADALLSLCGLGEGTLMHVVAQLEGAAAERAAADVGPAAASRIAEGQPPQQATAAWGWLVLRIACLLVALTQNELRIMNELLRSRETTS